MSQKLKELLSPLDKARKTFSKYVSRPIENISGGQKFWISFAFLCLTVTLLINNPLWRGSVGGQYELGDIARESLRSPADIIVVDDEATETLRENTKATIQPIFRYQGNLSDQAVQSFRSAWENLERKNANVNSNTDAKTGGNSPKWSGAGDPVLGKVFSARKFSDNELASVARVLRENTSGLIYDDKDRDFLQTDILQIDRQNPNQQSIVSNPLGSMTALSVARTKLEDDLAEIRSFSPEEVKAFAQSLKPLIEANVVYDSDATNTAKLNAVKDIKPITITLKRGQNIADEGDIITPEILAQINAVKTYSTSTRNVNRFFGLLALISALFWAAWKFIQHRGAVSRTVLSEERSFALFGFIVLSQTALMAIFFRIADFTAAQNIKAPLNDQVIWAFAIPFAFGSLLMTLLADRRIAIFTGLFVSLIAGLLAPKSLEFVLYSTIGSAVAVYGIGRYRSRQSVTKAGTLVGLASAATAVALLGYTQQPFILNTILLSIACGLGSGLVTAAVTAVFLPICESLFGILTDVKLLELSNADLPVLGQLALRAPGTNQHSHAVGQLSEEGCRVVGANGLLARIGALYHDIGKTAAPEHFVENQHGRNPHDNLKPAQSAKIIISHVTYGIKLAKELGLPPKIVDFISQHHGTRTLHYFLEKAQDEARDESEVEENDFRYPGPKPQFKEAAIMMIADSCEAAARSLSEPTPENIRFIVTKIIDAILADDQLDECDLTLRELTLVRESMIKSLVAIYHSRIDYPGYIPPNSIPDMKIVPELLNDEDYQHFRSPADIPISKGGEIETEAVVHSSKSPEKSLSQIKK